MGENAMAVRGIAHRGYPLKYPENTLVSFQAALDRGYTHLELDVQLSKDGVPVVIHDTTVDRTTDGVGKVKDLTMIELKSLRIAGNEQIPTLEEALALLKDRIIVDIELKTMGDLYPGLEKKVLDMVEGMGMREQCFLMSFDHYAVARARDLNRQIDVGLINHGASPALYSFIREYRCRYLSVHYPFITEAEIARCDQERVVLIPYTIDRKDDMARFARYPQLLICTNDLETWAAVSGQS